MLTNEQPIYMGAHFSTLNIIIVETQNFVKHQFIIKTGLQRVDNGHPPLNPKLLKLGLVREFLSEDIMGSDRTMRPLSLNNL